VHAQLPNRHKIGKTRVFNRPPWYLLLAFVVYPVVGVVLGYFGGRAIGGGSGAAAVRFVLMAQCVLVASLAPFFNSADRKCGPIRIAAGALLKTCGVTAATCVIAVALSVIFGGAFPAGWTPPSATITAGRAPPSAAMMVGWAVRSAAITAGFATVLIGVGALARRLGARACTGQAAAYAAAALMLGTVFYANPVIASTRGRAKVAVVQAAVVANPMVCVAGAAVDYDIMLSRRTSASFYNQSLIGPDHLYRYPRWWRAAAGYCVVGIVFLAVSFIGSAKTRKVSGGP